MNDVLVFDKLPSEPVRLVMCEWLRRHGIDPNDVVVPGWIARDERTYAVRYLGFDRDAGEIRLTDDGKDLVRRVYRVQLEGPPLPWPDDVSDRGTAARASGRSRRTAPPARRPTPRSPPGR